MGRVSLQTNPDHVGVGLHDAFSYPYQQSARLRTGFWRSPMNSAMSDPTRQRVVTLAHLRAEIDAWTELLDTKITIYRRPLAAERS